MIPPVVSGQSEDKQNLVGWKNTFNMRQVSLGNLTNQMGVKSGTKTIPNYRRQYSITSPTKSLDLLRKNLQTAINKDIDNVIKKYVEKFFQPAVYNIKNNLGKDSVGDDHIKEVCKQMLEEAKVMYKNSYHSRDSSPYDYSDSDSLNDGKLGRSPSYKRKESDTDSEKSLSAKRQRPKPLQNSSDLTNYKMPTNRDGPKWDPDRIIPSTLFIMGARANKVLGFGQTRGRLYVRHPNLVRYAGDQEDKEWLTSKNLMPPSGGKAYLMLLEDIIELTRSDDYKYNPNLQLQELKGFEVPTFLLNKIKGFVEFVRTDRKMTGLDVFEFRCQSLTPPRVPIESVSPTQTVPESTTKTESTYSINLPDMSPNSNHSIISNSLTASPISTSSNILSPNMLMSLNQQDNVMIIKDSSVGCISSILANHVSSESSQDF